MRRVLLGVIMTLTFISTCAQVAEVSNLKRVEILLDSSSSAYNAGNYTKSLAFNIELLHLANKLNDTVYLQKGYRNIAYDYFILGDTTQARKNFEHARTYASLIENDTIIGQNYMDLGNLYLQIGEELQAKSLANFKKSITYFKKTKDSVNLAKAYFNISTSLVQIKQWDKVLPYLKKLSKLVPYCEDYLEDSTNILWGDFYMSQDRFKKADAYFNKILSDSIGEVSPIEMESAYHGYSESLAKQERFEEALDARLRYEALRFSNNEKEKSLESQQLAAKFQLSEYKKSLKENELRSQLQEANFKNQEYWNRFLIIIVISSVLLIIFLLRYYWIRKDYVQKLRLKNKAYLQAKNESEELAKTKTTFFSTVSHELRTPLYGVIGLSTILMDDPKLKSHEEDLKSLKFSADYLLALINDVLQINKIDSKTLEENLERFNIREFIDNIVASFEFMRIQNSNRIHISVDKNIPDTIIGDNTRLSQILMNLVGNACKFTENGDIHITLEQKELSETNCTIRFKIKDTGIGIAAEKQLSIFDEFSQVASKHYTYQGTGLGLPIVKKLLNLSDTTIHISSKEHEGSTFYFALSFAFDQKEVLIQPSVVIDDEDLDGKEILIVDDNHINQIVTTKILQKSNVICSIANNGQEAVEMASQKAFDIILMDINMPVKDGLTATKEIRSFDEETPIIALTAVEIKEMRFKIYDAGLTDIIVKPYDISQFKRTILRNIKQDKFTDGGTEQGHAS